MLSKVLQKAAGNAAEPLFVESVFSTYLFTGNGSTQTITNGIDLAGEGGLVWFKTRGTASSHTLVDSAVGLDYWRRTNSTIADLSFSANSLTAPVFNSDGFVTSNYSDAGGQSGYTYASWTFRKAEKFFDVVTYTGNGVQGREIPHNLNSNVGMLIVKCTSAADQWLVWHRSTPTGYLALNRTDALITSLAQNKFGNGVTTISPTSSVFTVAGDSDINGSGRNYVAYLFAHNAGGFGADGSENVISCGSFTDPTTVNLGYEPQFVLFKATNAAGSWFVQDNMRGFGANGAAYLSPNLTDAEGTWSNIVTVTSTGFKTASLGGKTFIYIAIRRGPMKVPKSGTEVFQPSAVNLSAGTLVSTGFPVDMQIAGYRASFTYKPTVIDRLRGVNTDTTATAYVGTPKLLTSNTLAENTGSWYTPTVGWDNTGTRIGGGSGGLAGNNSFIWDFRRAPGFMDVVCYTGNGVAGRTIDHNLGVVPEMLIFKRRDAARNWAIVHANAVNRTISQPPVLTGYNVSLNFTVTGGLGGVLNSTAPTSSIVTLSSSTDVNVSGGTYVAYLFATVAGVSKVGSYTGNGSNQTINCGFAAGARFVLIKRCDDDGDWYVWDSARGIVAGNDPHLSLNTTAAEVTTDDSVDAASSGFIVNQLAATNVNVSSATYIYLAIA